MARKRLFKRFSSAVRRFDRDRNVFESLATAADSSFDNVSDKIVGLHELRSVDDIPDMFLPRSSRNIGHIWRTDKDYTWNRQRQRETKIRASYKGSDDSIEDLLREHGAGTWNIIDMASRLDIWNRQGGWNRLDGVCVGDGVYHPGCFQLEVDRGLDMDAFLVDFESIRPVGTVWYFLSIGESANIIDDSIATDCLDINAYSPALPTVEDTLVWAPSGSPVASSLICGGTYTGGVDGGLMFVTSSIPISTVGLYVSMGTNENPLPIEIASLQDSSELVEGI